MFGAHDPWGEKHITVINNVRVDILGGGALYTMTFATSGFGSLVVNCRWSLKTGQW